MATILVVDDELGIRALLSEILTDEGHTVELAENAAQARAARERMQPELVLLDIWMPDVDGISLLKEWGANGQLTMPVIMMSGHGTIDTAVEATKYGAIAFLEKPITLQKLLKAVEQGTTKPAPRDTPARGATSAGQPGFRDGTAPFAGDPAPAGAQVNGHAGGPPVLQAEQVFDLDRPLREARDAFEKSYFEFHLAKENGSMTRVAEKTGLERTHLYRKLKQLGVDLTRNRRPGSVG
ncbi:response regulator [Aquabacterium sp. J223]|uniref:response regulator n=1 Tax=Aquabacterium sp. J223 TaxID=2898431 RepID=UPI0021AD7C07|nr:response regulator [Aquabacterium sp. J223]UUX95931.1 response regulator [Aquabacterium sp. J223]